MWSTYHSLLSSRYLILIAAILGFFSIQINAAATGSRSQRLDSTTHESQHIPRTENFSGRVREAFSEAAAKSRRGSFRRSNIFQAIKSEDSEEDTKFDPSSLPAFIPADADLTPGLPQWVTNGRSLLGTKQAGPIRRQDGSSSGTSNVQIDADGSVTRKYKFNVNYADIAPDGVLRRQAILINGAFPGPTIEANYGDWIEVEVENGLTNDGTTIHWHGLLHKESQWMDGTPSIQQCPIAPGRTFTYRFKADQVGSSWWHSHSSAQYTSGAFGAMIIHGPGETGYDEDLGPVFLTDWYHESLPESLQTTMHSPNSQPPPADNLLINGKMNFPCESTSEQCVPNAGISKFYFSPGKKYRMRLINAGAAVNAKFSIDGHLMTVIAHDFTPVTPYQTDLVSLANGQRVDVVVEATGAAGTSYWMRFDIGSPEDPNTCIGSLASITRLALGAIYYDGADDNAVPSSQSSIDPARLLTCAGDPLEQLVPAEVIPANPQGNLMTIEMNINFTQSRDGAGNINNAWTINDMPYRADLSRDLLSSAHDNTLNTASDFMSLYDVGQSGTVRVVMYDYFQFSHHPMHLHGHNFQVLAEGYGAWDGHITNPTNPMRRDVHVLPRATVTDQGIVPAYTVIQFFTDNPGIWPFHCHLAWHNSAGLYANFMVRQSDIAQFQIPDSIGQTCADWNAFQSVAHPDQVDSGL